MKMNEKMKYAGMTVNERLFTSGLIDSYYLALKRKDVSEIVNILKKIELDDENIHNILKFERLV